MAAGVSLALFLVTAACVIAPWFFLAIQKAPGRPLTSTRSLLDIFLLLHTLYWLYSIMVLPPHNVYTRLKLPLSTPADAIRSILIAQSDTGDLPRPLETLLKHLGSFDVKTYYVRFGHSVVANCDYCRSFDEFGMFALPGALLSYICEAIVIGLVTMHSSDRERWRTMGVAAVAGAFCAEAYYIVTARIEIPKDDREVYMWHDNLLFFRRLLFLILPILVHNAPASTHTAAITNPTLAAIRTAEHTAARLQLLRLTRGAVMRIPDLRSRAAAWWTAEAREGAWIREDEGVRDLARKLQSGFDEGGISGSEEEAVGPLRQHARNTVTALKTGFTPSEFWRPLPP